MRCGGKGDEGVKAASQAIERGPRKRWHYRCLPMGGQDRERFAANSLGVSNLPVSGYIVGNRAQPRQRLASPMPRDGGAEIENDSPRIFWVSRTCPYRMTPRCGYAAARIKSVGGNTAHAPSRFLPHRVGAFSFDSFIAAI